MKSKISHIFLSGGGSAKESVLFDKHFVEVIDRSRPLIYIPNAKESKQYQKCIKWFLHAMTSLGITDIEMWDNLSPRLDVNLISGIYIGGGNTVKLLNELRQSGFCNYILNAAKERVPIYGGSAGAIILGEDIRTAPEARHMTGTESSGLKIVKNYSIVCHYKPADEKINQILSKSICKHIIAIPEKTAGHILGTMLTVYGMSPITIIRGDKVNMLKPNQSIELEDMD